MTITDGVLSRWDFEDVLTDSVGSNDLTAQGGSAAYAAAVGNLGKGVQFNGSLYLSKANPTNLQPTDTLTIGIACNIAATALQAWILDMMFASSQGNGISLPATTSTFTVSLDGGGGSTASSASIDTGSLVFLMLTYDKDAGGTDEGKLYIDNGADGTINFAGAISYVDTNLFIGAKGPAINYILPNNSVIYQLTIWDRVITSGERTTWYGGGSGHNFDFADTSNFFLLF